MQMTKKRVLVVDDSAFMRKVISDIVQQHPLLEVVATARNGQDALQKLSNLRPDVVTLDVEMPVMNGLDALKELMRIQPTPVVMLSSTTESGATNTVLAMEHGAVDVIAKPGGTISLQLHEIEEEIREKVYAASTVPVTSLVPMTRPISCLERKSEQEQVFKRCMSLEKRRPSVKKPFPSTEQVIVAIGVSTGGPRALQQVLASLPKAFAAPIIIVQHMPAAFTKSLADRLDQLSEIAVKEVENREVLRKGTAYIAPGGQHVTVTKSGASFIAEVDDGLAPMKGHRPSVDVLLDSIASLSGVRCIVTIMTGMGNDGVKGTKALRSTNNSFVIAEAEETCVVYGMPKAIVEAQLADVVLPLTAIADTIVRLV